MPVFAQPDFDHHEQVVFCNDPSAGLKAIIAIHNTNRGPALGGCRMYPYPIEREALTDVLRLSRGMSYKAAIANLPLGGGKSVIIGDPAGDKTPQLIRAMGVAVERLAGRYIVAEDSGTNVADLQLIAEKTRHVSGVTDKRDSDGSDRSGDPSPITARGVLTGIMAAVSYRLGMNSLEGVRVAVQGVGNVGGHLARYLAAAGAKLWLSDINTPAVRQLGRELDATVVESDQIYDQEVDVFSPCALGSIINDDTLTRLKVSIVAGAANNQLAETRHGQLLFQRGILYAPDYVVNAGGLIDVYHEWNGSDESEISRQVTRIGDTLTEIFKRSEIEQRATQTLADELARKRIYGTSG